MVYASFDDRQLDHMEFSLYGNPSSSQFQYPVTTSIRYPKVSVIWRICIIFWVGRVGRWQNGEGIGRKKTEDPKMEVTVSLDLLGTLNSLGAGIRL